MWEAREALARQAASFDPEEDARRARQAEQKKEAAHGEFLRLQESLQDNAAYAVWRRCSENAVGGLPSSAEDLPALRGWRRLLARWQEPAPVRALRTAIARSGQSPAEFFHRVTDGQAAADRIGVLDGEMKEQEQASQFHAARAAEGRALHARLWPDSETAQRQAALAFEAVGKSGRAGRRALVLAAFGTDSEAGAWLFQWDQAQAQKTLGERAAQYAAAEGIMRQLRAPVDKLAKAARRAGSKSMRSSFHVATIENQVRSALARLDEPKAALTSKETGRRRPHRRESDGASCPQSWCFPVSPGLRETSEVDDRWSVDYTLTP